MNSDRGVSTTTTAVIGGFIVSMKTRVAPIVITPVNSCENPISRPSPNWSASEIILLTVSPCG